MQERFTWEYSRVLYYPNHFIPLLPQNLFKQKELENKDWVVNLVNLIELKQDQKADFKSRVDNVTGLDTGSEVDTFHTRRLKQVGTVYTGKN